MRVGEALRARESDLRGTVLTIRETKSGKIHTIELPDDARHETIIGASDTKTVI